VITGKLVVIKIPPLGHVFTADIDDHRRWIIKISRTGFASADRRLMAVDKHTAGQKFIFMSTAGVREN